MLIEQRGKVFPESQQFLSKIQQFETNIGLPFLIVNDSFVNIFCKLSKFNVISFQLFIQLEKSV